MSAVDVAARRSQGTSLHNVQYRDIGHCQSLQMARLEDRLWMAIRMLLPGTMHLFYTVHRGLVIVTALEAVSSGLATNMLARLSELYQGNRATVSN